MERLASILGVIILSGMALFFFSMTVYLWIDIVILLKELMG